MADDEYEDDPPTPTSGYPSGVKAFLSNYDGSIEIEKNRRVEDVTKTQTNSQSGNRRMVRKGQYTEIPDSEWNRLEEIQALMAEQANEKRKLRTQQEEERIKKRLAEKIREGRDRKQEEDAYRKMIQEQDRRDRESKKDKERNSGAVQNKKQQRKLEDLFQKSKKTDVPSTNLTSSLARNVEGIGSGGQVWERNRAREKSQRDGKRQDGEKSCTGREESQEYQNSKDWEKSPDQEESDGDVKNKDDEGRQGEKENQGDEETQDDEENQGDQENRADEENQGDEENDSDEGNQSDKGNQGGEESQGYEESLDDEENQDSGQREIEGESQSYGKSRVDDDSQSQPNKSHGRTRIKNKQENDERGSDEYEEEGREDESDDGRNNEDPSDSYLHDAKPEIKRRMDQRSPNDITGRENTPLRKSPDPGTKRKIDQRSPNEVNGNTSKKSFHGETGSLVGN